MKLPHICYVLFFSVQIFLDMIFYLLQQFPVLFQTQCIDPLNNDVICGKALKSVSFVLKGPVTRGDLLPRHVPNPFPRVCGCKECPQLVYLKTCRSDMSQVHVTRGDGMCV